MLARTKLAGYGTAALLATVLIMPCLGAKPPAPPPVPTQAPAPVAVVPQPPLVNYAPVTPATTLTAPNLRELRRLKTANGEPRLPSPNPWFTLDLYQNSITRQQFETKLHTLFDPFGGLPAYCEIDDTRLVLYPSTSERRNAQFTLQFAAPGQAREAIRWFRTPAEFRTEKHPADKPLGGLRIAIDPGHIGGAWAEMEERSTRYHGSAPVREGDLNLITSKILKKQLEDAGASVYVVRDSTDPVTPYRPADMLPEARQLLLARSNHSTRLRAIPPDKLNLLFGARLNELSQFLFYRCSEIVERGNRIRNNFVPDITVTLYIDATPSSGRGRTTSSNANIFFVGGSYTRTEMADPEMQRRCVYKILEGSSAIESEVAADIASVFTQRTGIGPVRYGNSPTTRQVIPDNSYVVARNLAANRDYDGPVVCTEPYFMNNQVVVQRLLTGDYEGQRTFSGKSYGSIFREYADCVTGGLLKAYGPTTVIAGTTPVVPQAK